MAWSYYSIVRPRLGQSENLVDMGTGGGEVLSSFASLPPVTYAVEQYEPNVAIARERLGPPGVKTGQIDENRGVHSKIVQERPGHTSIQVTLDTYSHLAPGLQAAAARRFDTMILSESPQGLEYSR